MRQTKGATDTPQTHDTLRDFRRTFGDNDGAVTLRTSESELYWDKRQFRHLSHVAMRRSALCVPVPFCHTNMALRM